MSDKATIYVKYDVTITKPGYDSEPERVFGIFANLYTWPYPYGIVSSAACWIEYIKKNSRLLLFANPASVVSNYESLRRRLDVDFIFRTICISEDLFISDFLNYQQGKKSIEEINKWFFNIDTRVGDLYIDVTGEAPDNIEIKYCFKDYAYDRENEKYINYVWDAREYAESYINTNGEVPEELEDAFEVLEDLADVMTEEELNHFRETDISVYFSNMIEIEEAFQKSLEPVGLESLTGEIPYTIDLLDLEDEAYDYLKEAGLETFEDIMANTEEEMLSVFDDSQELLDELLCRLSELGYKLMD